MFHVKKISWYAISLPMSYRYFLLLTETFQECIRSVLLEPFFQLPPAGLVELNILLSTVNAVYPYSVHKTETRMIDDTCVELEDWAETAMPSLRLSVMWRTTRLAGEEWEWPDLGQEDEDAREFEYYDDLEDEYEYDSDYESHSDY